MGRCGWGGEKITERVQMETGEGSWGRGAHRAPKLTTGYAAAVPTSTNRTWFVFHNGDKYIFLFLYKFIKIYLEKFIIYIYLFMYYIYKYLFILKLNI